MDQHQQRRVNQAAEQFTDALLNSYKAVVDRGVSAQEGSTQVTRGLFNRAINTLYAQAEQNRYVSQHLADQQQRQAEAAQTLTQGSVNAYMNFVDSMFGYWPGVMQAAEAGVSGAASTVKAHPRSVSESGADLPVGDYDSLNDQEVVASMLDLSIDEMRELRDYEARKKGRSSLLERIDENIQARTRS